MFPTVSQVAGHLFEEGKAGSLVDDRGHFYKPIQPGPRGDRERAFYEAIRAARGQDKAAWAAGEWSPTAIAAVQAIASGKQITEVLFGRPAATPAPPRSPVPRSPRRARAGSTATGSIPVPRLNSSLPHFPTFRAEASFFDASTSGAAALGARDPMEVLERDELGLIDEVVVEELLQWSDEEGGSVRSGSRGVSPPLGSSPYDHGLSRSPDSVSDDGGEMMTGRHVMDGVREAHSLSLRVSGAGGAVATLSSSNGNGAPGGLAAALAAAADIAAVRGHTVTTATTEGDEAAVAVAAAERPARHSSAEDAQAAAMLGQAAWEAWDNGTEEEGDQFDALDDRLRGPPTTAGGVATFGRPLGMRRGTAVSAMSTDSIEEALRIHSLALDAKEREKAGEESGTSGASPPPAASPRPASPSAALAAWRSLPFTVRHAPLLRVIPKFYGVTNADGRVLLELEDLARWYRHPCIMDIKVGYRTWYPAADPAYIDRCRRKDAATTQAALGFKICGMQVYRHARGGYWRASKRWCKTLPEALVDKALTSFAHNEHGLRPADVYGGPGGVVEQLRDLEAWFTVQREFRLYSASLLVLYEGDAADAAGAHVRVRLVDFAHTFVDEDGLNEGTASSEATAAPSEDAGVDENFLGGLRAVAARLTAVARLDVADTLMTAQVEGHAGLHF